MASSNPQLDIAEKPRALTLACWVLLVTVCGCSAPETPFAPVEGTVTRNGRPVPHAQVIFFAEEDGHGPRSTAITDEAGHFRLAADDGRDGAPVGHHRVCVVDTAVVTERFGLAAKHASHEFSAKAATAKKATGKATIPPVYGRPADTPLRAEVRSGSQTIDVQLP